MARPRGTFERKSAPKEPTVWTKPVGGPSASTRRDAWVSLARLLRSGMGVPESLRVLAGDGRDALGKALQDTALRIEEGATLAEALEQQPGLLTPEEIQMIRAAERVGDLAPVFDGISEDIQSRIDLGRELIRRTSYPFMVLLASAIIGPLPAIVTGSAGAYLAAVGKNLLMFILAGPGTFFGLRAIARIPRVSKWLRRMAWKLPFGAGAYRDRVRARFARVLGRNVESGLPIYESLETAAAVTADPVIMEGATRVARQVEGGSELAPALGSAGVFAAGDRMQLVSAERSGTLDDAFSQLSTFYDERSQRGIRRIAAGLSMVLTAGVVIYVGLEVVSTYREAVFGPLELLEQELPHIGR